MTSPRVSVVLPAFNAAGTLARAMESIFRQDSPDWELIVVDDGSTDGTGELLREWTAAEPRLRVLTPGRVGLVEALNRGMAAARAPLVARMDADDESHPARLREQSELLAVRPEIGVASCGVEFVGDREASEGYARHVDWLNELREPEEIALNRFVESPLAHPSVMFRREIVERHGGYRAGDFPEDYELWLRWMDAGVRCAKLPGVRLRWHDGPDRLSRADARYAPEAFFRVKAKYLAREVGRRTGRIALASTGGGDAARDGEGGAGVWVWGAGRPTRQRAEHLVAAGLRIAGYIDVDAKKIGSTVGGRPVIGPRELPAPGETFILGYVGTRGARELIRAELRARGHVEGRDFLMGA